MHVLHKLNFEKPAKSTFLYPYGYFLGCIFRIFFAIFMHHLCKKTPFYTALCNTPVFYFGTRKVRNYLFRFPNILVLFISTSEYPNIICFDCRIIRVPNILIIYISGPVLFGCRNIRMSFISPVEYPRIIYFGCRIFRTSNILNIFISSPVYFEHDIFRLPNIL